MIEPLLLLMLTATASVAVAAGEPCDVLAAVACFRDLTGAPTADEIVLDPEIEILEPCADQVEKSRSMRTCMEEVLSDCHESTLYKELSSYVKYRSMYCDGVIACNRFVDDYHKVLSCTDGLRGEMVMAAKESDEAKAQVCSEFAACLDDISRDCHALQMLAAQQWNGYQTTCEHVNVTMDAISSVAPEETYCANLQSKSMQLNECNVEFEKEREEDVCKALDAFIRCAESAVARCDALSDEMDMVISHMATLTQPFCEGKCNFGAISGCYEDFGGSLWKLAAVVGNGTNLINMRERLMQSTGLFRNIEAMCSNIETEEAGILECLQEKLEMCPADFDADFIMKVDFTKQLCAEIQACANYPTQDEASAACFHLSTNALKELPLLNFTSALCTVFSDLGTCLSGALFPCPGDVAYVGGELAHLDEQLSYICPMSNLRENYTIDGVVEQMLDCGDLVDRATDLGDCVNTYMMAISEHMSNQDSLCHGVNDLDKCMTSVSEKCPLLTDNIDLFILDQRASSDCEEQEEEEGAGGRGNGNSASAFAASFVLVFAAVLLIV